MSRRALVLPLLLAPLAACEPSPELLYPDLRDGPPHPSADFVDGSVEGGNAHFFFLPPIAEREPEFDGSFNPELRPAVDVCVLDGGRCADPQPDGFPLRFTMDGEGSEAVRLVAEDEHYILNWHTRGLDPGRLYRLAVFPVPAGTELGHVDLEPVRGRTQPREGFLALHIGRTLPVKFRIETGTLCEGENDCVEEVVGPEGGTVTVPSGFAGADFPEGALDEEVVVAIERITPTENEPCLPTDLEQAEGCFRFQTDPGPTTFAVPVTAGVCLDPEVQDRPEHDQFQLHKFSSERAEDGVVALPNVAALFIDCEGFTAIAFDEDAGLLTRLVSAGIDLVDPLARFLGPQPLGAVDLGFGGEITEFSRIGWARPLAIAVVEGGDEVGIVGSTREVTVRVVAAHFDGAERATSPPIRNVEIEFTVVEGGGRVDPDAVRTDEAGLGTVEWRLGDVPGTHILEGSIPGGGSIRVEVEATSPPGRIVFVDQSGGLSHMAADGSGATPIVASGQTPVWSPDGSRIAFVNDPGAGNLELFVVNNDGSGLRRLTNNGRNDFDPQWAPDGSYLVYVHDFSDDTEIMRINPDGSGETRLTNNGRDDSEPAFSPDGSRIAFVHSFSFGNTEIMSMSPDGSDQVRLTNNGRFDFSPDWSPDGTRIAFSHAFENFEIMTMRADGSDQTRLTTNGRGDFLPRWSPDGEWIAFLHSQDDLNLELIVIRPDGSEHRRLTDNGRDDFAHVWSPDGTRLAYTHRFDSGRRNVVVVSVEGGGAAPIARGCCPDWTAEMGEPPDGSIPADGITVPAGFRADIYAEVESPFGLAFAPEGSAFGTDLYIASSGQDAIFRVPRPLEVVRFVTFVEEADPNALAFADLAGPFGDFLYVTANNRDGGRDGDHGGAIEKVAPDGSWSDFTRLGLDPTGAELGLGEPAGLAFGPSGDFGDGLWIANVSDRPADILVADPSGDLTIHWDDGKFSVDPDIGAQTVGLAFGPGSGFGSDLYAVDAGPGCLCVRVIDAFGQPRSVFLDPGVEPIAMVFGPGAGPFGDDAYVALTEDRSESWILRVAPDGTASMFASGFPGHISFDALEFSRDGLELFVATRDPGIVYRIRTDP